MKIERQNKIKTEFGTAVICGDEYYQITSSKEGNLGKLLHRLIFEKFYGKIPEGFVIHHKDGDKTNNCIFNLQLMRAGEHNRLHQKGKIFSEEHKSNISKSNLGKPKYSMRGEKHYAYKNYPRIIKHSKTSNGKQNYAIYYKGEYIKHSINKNKLEEELKRMESDNYEY